MFSWGRADYGQLGLGDDTVHHGFCSEPAEVIDVRGAKQVCIHRLTNNLQKDNFIK